MISSKDFSREVLAKVAYEMATKSFHGYVMQLESNLDPIVSLFPKWPLKEWDNRWCAAFVYYCCVESGLDLPVKYPHEDVTMNFAGCLAWDQWSKLDENKYFFDSTMKGLLPESGDIVLYNRVFSGKEHDHIGIVVGVESDTILVAEGNIGNVSAIVKRPLDHHIRGFIRVRT